MKRKIFCRAALLLAVILTCSVAAATAQAAASAKQIYEWRIYYVKGDGAAVLDDHFGKTLIPAYNRQGVTVGAFKPYKEGDVEQRYLLFVYPDIASFYKVKQEIWSDFSFREAARVFFEKTAPAPVYSNFETYLCEAFDKVPQMRTPAKDRGLFEMRVYRSPNEEANQRKIAMFNVDEIAVFDKTGINSVCYGEVLAGPKMPSLIYLTWYKDEPTRNAAWQAFNAHPDWARIRSLPQYANTATDNTSVLLSPLPYSQF